MSFFFQNNIEKSLKLSIFVLDSGLDPRRFSDDTHLLNSTPPADFNLVLKEIERCVNRVRVWMESNKLKLNEEKTEMELTTSRPQNFASIISVQI